MTPTCSPGRVPPAGLQPPHRTVPELTPTKRGPPRNVEVISTADLGDRSYIVYEDGVAIIIDPQRDIDRVQTLLSDLDLRCELVLETHIHNDYVTGGFELARQRGARYVVNAHDHVSFERTGVHDGDKVEAGPLTVEVVATPDTPSPTSPT